MQSCTTLFRSGSRNGKNLEKMFIFPHVIETVVLLVCVQAAGLICLESMLGVVVAASPHYRHEHHRLQFHNQEQRQPAVVPAVQTDSSLPSLTSHNFSDDYHGDGNLPTGSSAIAPGRKIVPSYLQLVYHQIAAAAESDNSAKESLQREAPFNTMFRAIVPSSFANISSSEYSLQFNLRSDKLNSPYGSPFVCLVLTVASGVQLEGQEIQIFVTARLKNGIKSELSGALALEDRRFYLFSITDFVLGLRDIAATITLNIRARNRDEIPFDMGTEIPILLIQFQDLPLKKASSRRSGASRLPRRASAGTMWEGHEPSRKVGIGELSTTTHDTVPLRFRPKNHPSWSSRSLDRLSEFTEGIGSSLGEYSKVEKPSSENVHDGQERHSVYAVNDLELSGHRYSPHVVRESDEYCRRKKWVVDARDDVGWDTVILPRKLHLGYCAGECPFPLLSERFNFSQHALLLDRHRLLKSYMDLPREFPRPCCVPISYKTLTVLEEDEDNNGYVIATYNKASVDSCGCR